ncbi:hypothetical protein [Kribbella sp. NPDC051770]|uniref:hypothetical protein n=1 Tax=Kribbella sp. NPDC051770 TaxID=3155413 RepID=UPI003418355C
MFVSPTGDGGARVSVRNVATGKETASVPTDRNTEVVGWNADGIWFMEEREHSKTRLWRPGSDPVPVDTDGRRLTAYGTTDRVLLDERDEDEGGQEPEPCVRVAVLDGSRLETLREQCGSNSGTLSPDGKYLLAGASAVDRVSVDTGAKARLQVPPLVFRPDHESLWEDATHVLTSGGIGTTRGVTVRCDVISGRCERIQDGPQRSGPAGPGLGRP